MLYSYKNRYPLPLPFRIKLSNGRTRTDPSTFTAEEIADAGYVAVSDPPQIDELYQSLSWGDIDWVINEVTETEHKTRKKEKLKAERYNQEISHPYIDTTRESQAMINGIWSASQINPALVVNFKGKTGWVQLDATAINSIAQQVVAHVQACFDNEKVLSDLIDAATTHEEIVAVDITTGWLTY